MSAPVLLRTPRMVMVMYFDSVLDENRRPIFDGTPDEIEQWLGYNQDSWGSVDILVRSVQTLVTPEEYLNS